MTVFVFEYIDLVVALDLFGRRFWKDIVEKTARDDAGERKNGASSALLFSRPPAC